MEPVFASTYTNPEDFILSTMKQYFQNDPEWFSRFGLTRPEAKTVIGKWAFYRNANAYPNSIEGRRAAAPIIIRDMVKAGSRALDSQKVFNFLQNIAVYMGQKYAAQYPSAQINKYIAAGVKRNVGDVAVKVAQKTAAAVESVRPWWLDSKIILPIVVLGVGGYFMAAAGKLVPSKGKA